MPPDPTKHAKKLVAKKTITQREIQNTKGQQHEVVPDIGSSGFASVVVIVTEQKPTPEMWYGVRDDLKAKLGESTEMQAVFEDDLPTPEPGTQNNLHLTAHLRQDEIPGGTTPSLNRNRPLEP